MFSSKVDTLIAAAIERLLQMDTSFIFYTGDMGEFDKKCSSAVRTAQRQHPELSIKLILVLPYFSNRLNADKEYYETCFDDIVIPTEFADVHYKSVITLRNRWIVDRADYLLAYVRRDYGGAYSTMQYARKLNKTVVNLADAEKQ